MPRQNTVDRSANRLRRRYVITLAAVAAGILVVGSLLRPRQTATDEPVPGPSQAELSRLARLSQRRSLDSMSEYFGTLANDVESGVVHLLSLGQTGVMWEPDLVLTARTQRVFPPAATLSTPTGDVGAITVTSGPDLPIAALRTSPVEHLVPPRRRPPEELAIGAWVVAVWRHDRQVNFTPAHFLGAAPATCGAMTVDALVSNVPWSEEMAGGGVFDLDENLVGVIIPCDDQMSVVTTESVSALLRRGQSLEGRLVGRYGLGLKAMSNTEQQHFDQPDGFLVHEVWTGSLADMAGLEPGDILLRIDGVPITSADQLEPVAAISEVEWYDLAVQRQDELLEIRLATGTPVLEGLPAPTLADGLAWVAPFRGVAVDHVAPDSPADHAGIRSGDRVVRIDGVDIADTAQVDAVLSTEREVPVFVELRRDNRQWGVLLP